MDRIKAYLAQIWSFLIKPKANSPKYLNVDEDLAARRWCKSGVSLDPWHRHFTTGVIGLELTSPDVNGKLSTIPVFQSFCANTGNTGWVPGPQNAKYRWPCCGMSSFVVDSKV